MEYVKTTLETQKLQNIELSYIIKSKDNHIWKNMVRIEQLKKESFRKKNELLRKKTTILNNKALSALH